MKARVVFCVLAATIFTNGLVFGQADWTRQSPAHVPPKRMYPAMAQPGDAVVMFGGLNLGPDGVFNQHNVLGDTWIWNGTDWTQASPFTSPPPGFIAIGVGGWGWLGPILSSTAPSPRFGHDMAFYPVSGFDVLYGGQGYNAFVNRVTTPIDTWNGACEGGPSKWSLATATHNPGPRAFHGMTTGPKGLTVLLFGGSDLPFPRFLSDPLPYGRDHNDTWTWGRRVACLPADDSQIPMHSEVTCLFTPDEGINFGGWSFSGLRLVDKDSQDLDHGEQSEDHGSTNELSVTFRAVIHAFNALLSLDVPKGFPSSEGSG